MKKNLLFLYSSLILLSSPIIAQQVVLSEIMFRPDGSNNEFIELYNPSGSSIDLSNYQIQYSTATPDFLEPHNGGSTILSPGEYVIIVEADFDIDNSPYTFPPSALVVQLDDNAFGSSGMANTADRDIFLLNSSNDTLSTYTYTADNSEGISDEKITLNSNNSSSNWANSTSSNGTPGSKNSVAPKEKDLAVTSIEISPSPAIENTQLDASITVKNLATKNADSYQIRVYEDSNFDSNPQPGELINSFSKTNLASGDSLTQNVNIGTFSIGTYQLIALVDISGDEDNTNDERIKEFEVFPTPPDFNDIVINEIMYDPNSGDPEWVELYNRSDQSYNLRDWKFDDASNSVSITDNSFVLDPGVLVVLTESESIEDIFNINSEIIVLSLPALNNSGDQLKLRSDISAVIDSLTYDNSWGGGDGVSLERIDAFGVSHIEENWTASESHVGASPGSINSISEKEYDLGISEITFEPELAIEGDDVSVNVKIKNYGLQNAVEYLFYLYLDLNNDSTGQTNERIREEIVNGLAVGDSTTFTTASPVSEKGKHFFIAEIRYGRDQYEFNNLLKYELVISAEPLPFNSLIINEFMYAPQDDEPEWIEIFNRSESPIDIKGWYLSDENNTTELTDSSLIIQPDSFLVISDNERIFDYYNNIPADVLVAGFPALNNGGDKIVLSDSLFFINDSLEYTSDWGGRNGNSLERIDTEAPSNNQENWGSAISPDRATPGKTNSIIPRDNDLALLSFETKDEFLVIDQENTFIIDILNTGRLDISGAGVNIYNDLNNDSLFTQDELLTHIPNISIHSGVEERFNFTASFSSPGDIYLLAVVDFAEDSYPLNDSLFLSKEVVEPTVMRGEIVVNEFLYAPISPYPEWIELFNTTDQSKQLRSFSIADERDTVEISTQNILLPANSFIVIARDSIIAELYDIPVQLIVSEFPSLNNSGDKLMLLDNFSQVLDSLDYTSEWGGKDGRSLEKIRPTGFSTSPHNWITSTDTALGTPGKLNSFYTKDYDVELTDFYSLPRNPSLGQTVTLHTVIKNRGFNPATFSIELYKSDASGAKVEWISTSFFYNISPGASDHHTFSHRISSFYDERFYLARVAYSEDEDTTNNSKLIFINSNPGAQSLIINEIMFDPDGDEPEWIELYNRSGSTINLRDWVVSDVLSNPVTTPITFEDRFVNSGQYFVLAKDSKIFEFHNTLNENQVALVPFANLNNTIDGIVLYDRIGSVVDSVFYSETFGREDGYSIERIEVDGPSNSPSNWGISTSAFKGTPGSVNSVVPKNYDLAVDDIFISPEFPQLNENIKLSVSVTNFGLQPSGETSVKITATAINLNEEIPVEGIDTNQTVRVEVSGSFAMPESFEITAQVNFAKDENHSNDKISKTFYSGYAVSTLLINEVMYDPLDGNSEWIEFVNATQDKINLRDWLIAEKSTFDEPDLITNQDVIINPGEYFIIADDTSNGEFTNASSKVIEVGFGELNSTEDEISIFDFRLALIDSLNYFSAWGGGDGFSIERISLSSPTNERSNWLPSVLQSGATPGTPNSTIDIRPPVKGQVAVNEIMFEPSTNNSEFIEFFNTSEEYVEIANWTVEDDSKNRSTLSRTTYVIPPESYFVAAADSSILLNYPDLKNFDRLIILNRNMSLNNSEDLVLLNSAFGATVDSVFYNSDWSNKNIPSTDNKSLERINPTINSNDDNNWSTSVAAEGATPGKPNSILINNQPSGEVISVSPNPFSPDGDGFEDFAIINYNLPTDVSSIKVQVFDSKGRKVRTLTENGLFGKQGSLIFDGYNDDGKPLKIGIYILFIEIIASDGSQSTHREVAVVARKL